jgi:uncharacterized RDD family membrane protein YckC
VAYPGPPGPAYQGSAVPAVPYTDWIHRAGGYLIDVAPVIILEIIGGATGHFSIYFLFLLIAFAYSIYNRWYLGGTTGQSFGKKALGLMLVSEDTGQPIGIAMAFVRDICHILDSLACFIGWLFPLWDPKRQTFADKIIRTIVIPA